MRRTNHLECSATKREGRARCLWGLPRRNAGRHSRSAAGSAADSALFRPVPRLRSPCRRPGDTGHGQREGGL